MNSRQTASVGKSCLREFRPYLLSLAIDDLVFGKYRTHNPDANWGLLVGIRQTYEAVAPPDGILVSVGIMGSITLCSTSAWLGGNGSASFLHKNSGTREVKSPDGMRVLVESDVEHRVIEPLKDAYGMRRI